MLLTCLMTSCGEKKTETPDDQVDNSAKTITMWVVTEDETTEQAKKLVNQAFTKVTKAKFKTNVVIKFCTEDEYYEKLEGAIKANQAEIELKEAHDKALRVYLRAHKGEEGKTQEQLKADFYVENPQYAKYQKKNHVYSHRKGMEMPPYDELAATLELGDLLVVKPKEGGRHVIRISQKT